MNYTTILGTIMALEARRVELESDKVLSNHHYDKLVSEQEHEVVINHYEGLRRATLSYLEAQVQVMNDTLRVLRREVAG